MLAWGALVTALPSPQGAHVASAPRLLFGKDPGPGFRAAPTQEDLPEGRMQSHLQGPHSQVRSGSQAPTTGGFSVGHSAPDSCWQHSGGWRQACSAPGSSRTPPGASALHRPPGCASARVSLWAPLSDLPHQLAIRIS